MRSAALPVLALLSALAPAADVRAQDADDEAGFGDVELAAAPAPAEADAEPSPWALAGFTRTRAALWVERLGDNPLASLRQTLLLDASYTRAFTVGETAGRTRVRAAGQAFYDFAYLYRRDSYDEPTREAYEWELRGRETEVAVTLGAFELALGRQIVNWGQGEVWSLLDLVNPRDLREPALTPAAELRMAVLMTRASLALGEHRLEVAAVHEPFFGALPPPLASFSPLRRLLLETPTLAPVLDGETLRYAHVPDHELVDFTATQLHARLAFTFPGFDLTLQGGSLLEPIGVPALPAPAEFGGDEIAIRLHHPRYEYAGASAAVPVSDLLFRFEAAAGFERPIALRRTDGDLLQTAAARSTQLDGLVGVTYVPSSTVNAALELAQSYLPADPAGQTEFASETLWPVTATRIALRLDYAFLHERARLGLLLLWLGVTEWNAWVARAELGYAFSDPLSVLLQYATYHPSDRFGPFYGFDRHDYLALVLQWSFSTR